MVDEETNRGKAVAAGFARTMTLVGLVSLAGAAASTYSLWHHVSLKLHGATDAACNINATVNCDAVAQSGYSELFGVPLGAWGLAYFLTLLLVAILAVAGKGKAAALKSLAAVMVGVGALAALALAAVSAFVVKALCLSCLAIYGCNLALAAICYGKRQDFRRSLAWGPLLQGALLLVPAAIVAGGVWQGFKNHLQTPDVSSDVAQDSPTSTTPATAAIASQAKPLPISRSAYQGLGEDYRRGSDEAKVTLVVFSDFQCPACRNMAETLELIAHEYGERVQVVYRNYPLDHTCNSSLQGPMHQYACKLAVLARCAGQFGKFWDYHNLVFGRQADLREGAPEAWAEEVGLSKADVSACLASKSILEKVQDDIKLGNELNVDATPSVYLNGRKVYQNSIQTLRNEIDKVLQSN